MTLAVLGFAAIGADFYLSRSTQRIADSLIVYRLNIETVTNIRRSARKTYVAFLRNTVRSSNDEDDLKDIASQAEDVTEAASLFAACSSCTMDEQIDRVWLANISTAWRSELLEALSSPKFDRVEAIGRQMDAIDRVSESILVRNSSSASAADLASTKLQGLRSRFQFAGMALLFAMAAGILVRRARSAGQARLELAERSRVEQERVNEILESRVAERTSALEKATRETQESLKRLQQVQLELVETSRRAGMAEVATAVLHNVGNVLNSVNVSAAVIADTIRSSRSSGLKKLTELLEQGDLATAFQTHPKAQQIAPYLRGLGEALSADRDRVLGELDGLQRNIEHIKVIVSTQQSQARSAVGAVERLRLSDLVEDALVMNRASCERRKLQVVCDFADVPEVPLERHKVFQIITNLLTNAVHAAALTQEGAGRITLRIRQASERTIAFEIEDNGCGIAPENAPRIFKHGFTTKKDGHGFGLHSSAIAATEMGGRLSFRSDGLGRGAVFTLELPTVAPLRVAG